MLTLTLDPGAERPLYEQIYRQIRQEIASGGLPAGARLPSKRALAAHLKVSVVTVEGAYGQLLAEGYLRSEPKRGFFVWMPEEVPLSAPGPTPSVPPDRTAAAPLPYDFSTSAVDTAHFPFSTWARLMREVLSQEDSALLDSPPPQGVPELRRAIVRYLRAFRGIRAEPEQVVVGAGAEYLTSLLLQLLGHSGGWAVEDPGYRKACLLYTSAFSATKGDRVSAAGEALQMLPPTVPLLRIWVEPTVEEAIERKGTCLRRTSDSLTSVWLVIAPMRMRCV